MRFIFMCTMSGEKEHYAACVMQSVHLFVGVLPSRFSIRTHTWPDSGNSSLV